MFLDTMEALCAAESVEEVWSTLVCYCDGHGFDRLLYGNTRFRTANSFGDFDDLMILSNHPEGYTEQFMNGGLYFNGPMVRWAAENVGAQSWRELARRVSNGELSDGEMAAMALNVQYGVTVGYSIGFAPNSTRNKGALGLTAREGLSQDDADRIWSQHGREILVAANFAHLKLMSLPHPGARRKLTPRQREVLEWVGDGKTNQDIALIMGLTSATVEKHLRLAREALDVETTAQAVLKASFQNQIFHPTR